MRHQSASIHELARLEMLAGLPGETLADLAERMERQTLTPGERLDVRGHVTAVLNGLAHATSEAGQRKAVEPGAVVDEQAVSLRAVTPVTIVRCERSVFDDVIGAPPEPV